MRESYRGGVSPSIDRGDASSLHHPNHYRAQSRGLRGDAGHGRFVLRAPERAIAQMGRRLRLADSQWRMVAPVVFSLCAHWGSAFVVEYVVFVESGAAGRADVRELDFPRALPAERSGRRPGKRVVESFDYKRRRFGRSLRRGGWFSRLLAFREGRPAALDYQTRLRQHFDLRRLQPHLWFCERRGG